MHKTVTIGLAAGVIVALAGLAPAQAGERGDDDRGDHRGDKDTATLTVFHGVPDLDVDVYVDGDLTLDDFEPGDFSDALKLDAGTYTIAITESDADDDSDTVIDEFDITLEEDGNYTAAAHLDEDGDATATLYTNDTDSLDKGDGRLTVRHVAAAPAVDVLADGDTVIWDLENPNEEVLTLDADTYEVEVVESSDEESLIGPADVDVAKRTNTIVYAWGSQDDDNLELATQTVDVDDNDNGYGHDDDNGYDHDDDNGHDKGDHR